MPNTPILKLYVKYGNTGCGVFKRGGTKLERFLPKNQHTQRKLLNFEKWINGVLKKSIIFIFSEKKDTSN